MASELLSQQISSEVSFSRHELHPRIMEVENFISTTMPTTRVTGLADRKTTPKKGHLTKPIELPQVIN